MGAITGKSLTCDNLQKKGKILANRFYMRKGELELMDHSLLHELRHFESLLLAAWAFLGFLIILLQTIFWLGRDSLMGK